MSGFSASLGSWTRHCSTNDYFRPAQQRVGASAFVWLEQTSFNLALEQLVEEMKMKTVIASLLILAITIAYSVAAETTAKNESLPRVYKVMPRLEIDKLGLDGELPPNHSYEPSLEGGLNMLAAEGWELVAVEGGRMRTFNGGGDAALDIHPTYIFRKKAIGG